jgi:hypothetical protein
MKSATHILISTFGSLVGLIGIEHGLGAILQGDVAPEGLLFLSWPEAAFFRILGGEPALTIVPNLLVTGILAILFSLLYLVSAVWLVQRNHGGLVLMLLSIAMLLAGGGIFPPVFGIILGAAASRIPSPPRISSPARMDDRLPRRRSDLPAGLRQLLARLWPWFFGAGLIAWLSMFPGVPALHYFFGVDNPTLIFVVLICMFGFLFLAGVAGVARDLEGIGFNV